MINEIVATYCNSQREDSHLVQPQLQQPNFNYIEKFMKYEGMMMSMWSFILKIAFTSLKAYIILFCFVFFPFTLIFNVKKECNNLL